MFLRAVEAIQLLRASNGQVDWQRFEHLVVRFGFGCIAASMLRLISDEVRAPIPAGVIERLWGRQASLNALELVILRIPPYRRRSLQQLALKAIHLAHSESAETASGFAAALNIVARPGPRAQLLQAVRKLAGFENADLHLLWQEQAARASCSTGQSFPRGFSFPEDEGRWTDGEIAILEVPADAPLAATVRVRLVVRPFFPPGAKRFRFEMATGVGLIHRRVLTTEGGTPVDVIVAARAIGSGKHRVVIALRLTDAGRPMALGLSDDPRLLGLFLEHVEVLPGAEPQSHA
jgi:hypothetical protein